MDPDERLRLDYDQTTQILRTLTDVRFKLLAFVPTISGAAVGLLGRPRPAAELLGVGLLGLVATFGIFVYELRNSQIANELMRRAKELERMLGLPSALGGSGPGGVFNERPSITMRLLVLLPVSHGHGLALVYAAALAGWSYLVAWGGLGWLEVPGARSLGALAGLAVGVLVLVEIERTWRRSGRIGAPPAADDKPAPRTG